MPMVLVTELVEWVAGRFLTERRMGGSSEQSISLEPADRGMQRTENIKIYQLTYECNLCYDNLIQQTHL